MVELTYAYYKDTFHGQLDEQTFQTNLPKAQDLLDSLLSTQPSDEDGEVAVRRALCYGVEYQQVDTQLSTGLTSERLDDYSYTKDVSALQTQKTTHLSQIISLLAKAGLYNPLIQVRRNVCCHC